ncbi:undecaprenyldiphospho-muramoylpentapeptide beta-N-acetylglucosaminyltransferase [Candidatus Methylospira mobilis]|uniref:UDP-N-acetylglucosamine--N-acetylmuramyl-(pentapeptide) pyrophosphoryl-undecaprenol N-acetylglucosamine transferase n=1 Tax=Candidatus Methylospira mobilis TaxID=1808979 RepID=A0A5Q0BJQ4_9GAMM|nr:undecaprenyldiphospho-muramoylpentapeptide beta-N-acetylglucosaminyltransferase [Candidatus Methylospira mobilis]QFY42036.1 undecaprenyldiphospho-muramoylpentapeptide beta-N-acetylglucosaminyltransferase [Candidatus Methylospira mobilis]WNV03043.1 undecaprenyldiphospho-muramoylpentapeptide beta-N-acetylglucosaminyltransferase [Candidatus Methylospira mobilis]
MAAHILILAGGTGGHIYPALAVAEELIARGCRVTWMGTRSGMEAGIVPARGIPMEWLNVAGFRGKGISGKLLALWRVFLAVFQANRIVARLKPDLVLGLGGFVAGPGGLVAWLRHVPLVIHEQNRVPGTTNRLLARFAKVRLEAFPGSFSAKVAARCIGNPLRKEIVAALAPKRNVPERDNGVLHILVLGGSQGAAALNETVPAALAKLDVRLEIIHQTGARQQLETQALYRQLGLDAKVTAFIEEMAEAYQWADLAVCRSGAMTVSELMAAGLPAVLVPFPHAIDDHQTQNARYLVDAGAAVLVRQPELTAQHLASTLKLVIESPALLKQMSRQASLLAKTNAASEAAAVCMEWGSR